MWWRAIPILQYHSVAEPEEAPRFSKSAVSPEAFARQVDWLAAHGYEAVTLAAVFSEMPVPKRPVVFTFDDGYRAVVEKALPVLRAREWPATVFCCPGLMERGESPWRAPLMNRDEMMVLAKEGWEIGAHTLNHPELPGLSGEEQRREIEGSRDVLREWLGEAPRTFAYPRGKHDASARAMVEAAGFVGAVGTGKGNRHRPSERYRLRRIFMRSDTQDARLRHRLGLWYDLGHRLRQAIGRESC